MNKCNIYFDYCMYRYMRTYELFSFSFLQPPLKIFSVRIQILNVAPKQFVDP